MRSPNLIQPEEVIEALGWMAQREGAQMKVRQRSIDELSFGQEAHFQKVVNGVRKSALVGVPSLPCDRAEAECILAEADEAIKSLSTTITRKPRPGAAQRILGWHRSYRRQLR